MADLDSTEGSPCTGVCKMDEENEYCIGCYRTLAEIAGWRAYTPSQKREVVEQIGIRKLKLNLP